MKLLLGSDRPPVPGRRKRRRECAISDHVLWIVFLRLPLKSLFRCKAVCKAFYSVISDPLFAADYRRCSPRTPSGEPACGGIFIAQRRLRRWRSPAHYWIRFVAYGGNKRDLISREKEVSYSSYPNRSSLRRRRRIPPYYGNNILASSGGILLCKGIPQSDCERIDYYVVNPLTKEWRALPDSPKHESSIRPERIGFVCREGDPSVTGACDYNYEVVIIRPRGTFNVIQTYSSQLHDWSVVSIPSEFSWQSSPISMVSIRGVIYWVLKEKLISYNTANCKLEELPLPVATDHKVDICIGDGANGTLLLYAMGEQGFYVWVKDDCRQPLNPWQREHQIDRLEIEKLVQSLSSGSAEGSGDSYLCLVDTFPGDPDKVFIKSKSVLFLYDWRSEKLEILYGSEEIFRFDLRRSQCIPYHLPSWHLQL